jgi:hypothetical protein
MLEQRSGDGVVVSHAAAVRVHPPEAELGLCIAPTGRRAVEQRGQHGVPGHAFTMLERDRLRDEQIRPKGFLGSRWLRRLA